MGQKGGTQHNQYLLSHKIIALLFAMTLCNIFVAPLCFAKSADSYADLEITIAADGTSSFVGSTNIPFGDIVPNESISQSSDLFTTKNKTNWTFSLITDEIVNVSVIKVHLPAQVVISEISPQDAANIAYEDSIVVTFVEKNKPLTIAIEYSFSATSPSNTAATNSLFSGWNSLTYTERYSIYALIAALVLVIIGAGTFMYKTHKRNIRSHDSAAHTRGGVVSSTKHDETDSIVDAAKLATLRPTLNETQLKIIDTLIFCGGVATQNKIHHATQIPKASLSRNVDILVRKQILQKLSGGYTNQLSFAAGMKKQ